MIVKDEQDVIERCLASVKDHIDYWVIVDTGSTDNTKEVITNYMKDIPGELHSRTWVDFAHNRNEALELAKNKADYVLIVDADDSIEFPKEYTYPPLALDCYRLIIKDAGSLYQRPHLIKISLPWKWMGVLHEGLYCPEAITYDVLQNVYYIRQSGGARAKDPKKYEKDAEVLEKALLTEPNNTRYVFYLAQSYLTAGNLPKAKEVYAKRAAMGGWDEEVYWSLLQIAKIDAELNKNLMEVTNGYLKAYAYRPTRAEPLFYLAALHRAAGNHPTAYFFAKAGLDIKHPSDALFIEDWIYNYGLLFEYSVAAYWTGHMAEAKLANEQLLEKEDLPDYYKPYVLENKKYIH